MSRKRLGSDTDTGKAITFMQDRPYIIRKDASVNKDYIFAYDANDAIDPWKDFNITGGRSVTAIDFNDDVFCFLSLTDKGWIYHYGQGAMFDLPDTLISVTYMDNFYYALNEHNALVRRDINGVTQSISGWSTNSKASGITIGGDTLYVIDEDTNKVHKTKISTGTNTSWAWSEIPGAHEAIKVVANEYFVCIIDKFNQICIHNGKYWEVMNEYGFAKDIALDDKSTLYMVDKDDDGIYRL